LWADGGRGAGRYILGGQLAKKLGQFFFFQKILLLFFFEELLVCVCGYKVVYMCVGVRSTTLLQFKVENALKNFFLSFLLDRFSKIKEIFFFKFSYFFIIFEKCLAII
jgi:hypothetical protein